MANIKFENKQYIYTNENSQKCLLDCGNHIANVSRIPLHTTSNGYTITTLLDGLYEQYINLFGPNATPIDGGDYYLIDILLANQLIHTSKPAKVAEFGCTNGRLSYHLSTVLGKFHPDSTLCGICDTIGNESRNFWLDMVSLVAEAPKLSLIASDYDETNLCGNNFDIVILNGSVPFTNEDAVIKEASRIVKSDGLIICYAWERPNLVNCMKKAFSTIDDYPTGENTSIMVGRAVDLIEEHDEIKEWKSEVEKDIAFAETLFYQKGDKKQLLSAAQKLNHHADIATINNELKIKIKTLELKEKLLIKYVEL